jgi:hypothetical protein
MWRNCRFQCRCWRRHSRRQRYVCAADEFFGVEGHAERGGAILSGLRHRHDEHHHDIRNQPEARAEDGEEHECDAHPGHVDVDVGGDAVADAAPHRTFANLEQALARRGTSGGSRAARALGTSGGTGGGVTCGLFIRGFHRTHLFDDAFDFRDAHDGLVRPEHSTAFLADGLFEIGHHFGAIRTVLEAGIRSLQVGAQQIEAGLLELIRISVEADADYFLHG